MPIPRVRGPGCQAVQAAQSAQDRELVLHVAEAEVRGRTGSPQSSFGTSEVTAKTNSNDAASSSSIKPRMFNQVVDMAEGVSCLHLSGLAVAD